MATREGAPTLALSPQTSRNAVGTHILAEGMHVRSLKAPRDLLGKDVI